MAEVGIATPKLQRGPLPSVNTKPKTIRIQVEENDNIPPTGLFVGLNGRGYLIKPGSEVDVPPGVVEILENAIYDAPQVDPSTGQIVGTSKRMRYPFRVVRKKQEE